MGYEIYVYSDGEIEVSKVADQSYPSLIGDRLYINDVTELKMELTNYGVPKHQIDDAIQELLDNHAQCITL